MVISTWWLIGIPYQFPYSNKAKLDNMCSNVKRPFFRSKAQPMQWINEYPIKSFFLGERNCKFHRRENYRKCRT